MNKEEKEMAYRLVFDDLISNYGGLPIGKYDARNKESFHFIVGVYTIMELIATNAEKREIFNTLFTTNMEESELKAGTKWS